MKHIILYPLISVLTLSISGAGSYLYQKLTRTTAKTDTTDTSDNDDDDESIYNPPIDEPGFSKMINKLMNVQEVKAGNAAVTLSTTESDDIYLNFSNLDIDLSGALSGNVSSLKLNGTLNVKYKDINEELSVYYDTDMLYIDYNQKSFSFSAPKTIAGITGVLSKLNINVPTIPDMGSSLDLSTLMNSALGILDTVEEKKTATGYEYILDCNDFFSSLNLPISIKGAKLALVSDNDYNFIGGRTVEDSGIEINSSYAVKLDVNNIQIKDSSSYSGLSDEQKSHYTDYTTRTTNLITSIASLMQKKNFIADFNADVSLSNNSIQKQTFKGTLKGDLSSITEDVSKGKYEVSLEHLNNGTLANNVYATYKDNNIYVALNNLIKGKISSSTLDDIIRIVSSEINTEDLPEITKSLDSIIEGTDLAKLLSGDLSVYKNFISDFETTTNGFVLSINAKAFGLGDYILKITLDDSSTDVSEGFKITIENFSYKNINLDFTIDVKPQENISFKYTDAEFASFKDYCGIISIFNTVTKLADERKINTTYSFNLQNIADGSNYLANGEISADVTSLSLDSGNNYYGDYRLTLATNLNGYDHNLDFVYQDHDLFLQMDDFFKQKMSDSEVGSIYDIVNKDKENTSKVFDSMNTVIHSIVDEVKGSYSVKCIEDYLTLDKENIDSNVLKLDINLPLFFAGSTLADEISSLSLYINTDDDSITAISCKGFEINNKLKLDFTLKLHDEYEDFHLTEEETKYYTEIDSASKIINGFYSLPTDLKQFSVNLNGEIKKKDDADQYQSYLGLYGDAQVDITDKDSPDVGGTLHLLQQPDSYEKETDHKIDYLYSGTHTAGQTVAMYTSKDTDTNNDYGTTSLVMNNSDLFSIYDRVMSLKDNKTNLLYRYLKAYFDTTEKVVTGLPILDAFKNKDYTILLNDYIKQVEIKDKTVTLKLASSILNRDDTSGNVDTIIVTFDDNYKISKAEIDGYYDGYSLHAEINLGEYDSSLKPTIEYNDSTKDNFVDVHGFDTLINCGITTTNHHFFDLSGSMNLDASVIGISAVTINTYYQVYVSIVDSTVKAYLSFKSNSSATIDSSNFYGVEFFVENEFVLSERTTTDKKKNKTVELYKLTPKEITDNIAYYLLSYILNVEDATGGYIMLDKIFAAMKDTSDDSSVVINHNYSSLLDKAVQQENEDGSGSLNMTCSLGKLISLPVLSFSDKGTSISIGYNSDMELTNVNMSVDFSIAGIMDGTLKFNATRNNICLGEAEDAIRDEKMARYNTFLNAYNCNDNYVNLAEYQFNDYTFKRFLGLATGGSVQDNGAKLTLSYSDSTKNYFFGVI